MSTAPHLIFMAYLQRIVNAGGRIEREFEKEFALGTTKADLFVAYGKREDVIELKLMRGGYTLPDGLKGGCGRDGVRAGRHALGVTGCGQVDVLWA
jgi:hypothetical protein